MNREIRLYRYLARSKGWQGRTEIMLRCGFGLKPVTSYVEFQNSIMRLNAQLVRVGKEVVRQDEHELYRLVSVDKKAA